MSFKRSFKPDALAVIGTSQTNGNSGDEEMESAIALDEIVAFDEGVN